MSITIPCVILSGGKSSRMGRDKSLLPFKEYNTLIEYQYSKLSNIFQEVYISSKTDKFDFLEDKSKIIYDNSDIYSPMVALKSILEQFSKVFIITVDNPFIEESTILTIIKHSKEYDITIASTKDKTHNLCGIYSSKCLSLINTKLNQNNHRINNILKESNSKIILFEDEQQFFNINTKKDYECLFSKMDK